jgi:hypothetical protein
LADDVLANFGNEVDTFRRIEQKRFDTSANASRIELDILSLVSEAAVEVSNRFSVPQFSFSDEGIDEVRILFYPAKSMLMEQRT